MDVYQAVQAARAVITEAIEPYSPQLGLVLGSGLGDFADSLEHPRAISYDAIPGFHASSVAGHAGRLVAGKCGDVPVVALQGRVHLYEGHSPSDVVLPVRALIAGGCQTLIITNAAGGVRDDLMPGDLVLLRDHLNLQGHNPLVGPNDDQLGPRFPDMSDPYCRELRREALRAADSAGIPLTEGVYAALLGPSYETPAEIRMLRALGADLAGMSTAFETIAANHMGARVVGISCVTNKAAGLGAKLSHDDVKQTAQRVKQTFVALLRAIIARIGRQAATPSGDAGRGTVTAGEANDAR